MRPRKVLLLSSEYPPNVCGGLGTHVASITAALSDRVAFDIVTPEGFPYASPDDRIRVLPVPLGRENDHVRSWLRFCESAVARVRAERLEFDCIHCHDWMTALAGILLREETGRPLVLNVHLPQSGGETMWIEKLALAAADAVIVNSVAVSEELSLKATAVHVIPNGVDPDRYRPRADWPADDGYILFVGRLVPQKGLMTLMEAMAALLRRATARLVVVGDGILEFLLRRAARNFGCADRVDFVGWARGDELVRLYQGAQFVVMPSVYEPFGIVALEAMACARPVIASATGGLQEIIEDGVTGVLVPVGDHLRLSARMVELLENPRRRAAIGTAARARAMEYDWTAVADATLRVLDGLEPSDWTGARLELILNCAREVIANMAESLGNLAPSIEALGGRSCNPQFSTSEARRPSSRSSGIL
jgi:glycogen(starch) synthase